MISLIITFYTSALGAFFYRARGGFNPLPWGTTGARLVFWAIPAGISVFVLVVAHGAGTMNAAGLGVFAAILAYVSLLEDQSSAIDNDKPLEDMAQMAQIGAMRAAVIALPAAPFVPWMVLLPIFGALAGPAYFFGWRWLHGKDSGIYWGDRVFACGGSEWGEVLTGAAFGFGIGLLGSL